MAGRRHPPVVVQGHERELALLGLDAAPLEGESVGTETQVGDQGDVLGIPIERIAGVAAHIDAAGSGVVLELPPVVVHVAAFDLVGSRGRAPQEAVGKSDRGHGGTVAAPCGQYPSPRSDHRVRERTPGGARREARSAPSSARAPIGSRGLTQLAGWCRERSLGFPGRPPRPGDHRSQHLPGVSPNEERQRVFGGQVAAQSLMAAGRTVETGRPHSLHAYFLRPGDTYRAHPLRGRPHP